MAFSIFDYLQTQLGRGGGLQCKCYYLSKFVILDSNPTLASIPLPPARSNRGGRAMLSLIFRAHLSRIAAPQGFCPDSPLSDNCRSDQVSSDPRRHPSDDHHFSPVPRYRGSVEARQRVRKHFSLPPSSEKQFSSRRLLGFVIKSKHLRNSMHSTIFEHMVEM